MNFSYLLEERNKRMENHQEQNKSGIKSISWCDLLGRSEEETFRKH